MQDLKGKVAVVTGGAGGIGSALVEEFMAEGAKVVIADVQQQLLDGTVAELSSRGEVIGVRTDVTDPKSVDELADRTYERVRRVSCAVQQRGRRRRPSRWCGRRRSTTGSGCTASTSWASCTASCRSCRA